MVLREAVDGVLAKLSFHELKVQTVRELAPRFRLITLGGETLKGASYNPGDKLQIVLGMLARTYSPFAFDGALGTLSLVAFLHGDAPGAAWARDVKPGDVVRGFGPRRSIALSKLAGPSALFGDETSFGVARALLDSVKTGVSFVLEVEQLDVAAQVLAELGITNAQIIARRADDGHLPEVAQRIADLLASAGSSLVLTGRAAAIQSTRSALKKRSIKSAQLTKAYWAPGKRGLD